MSEITFGNCRSCNGTTVRIGGIVHIRLDSSGELDLDAKQVRGHGRPVGEHTVVPCWTCRGLTAPDGLTYARYRDRYDTYGDAYKNLAALKGAITRGKATVCKSCQGGGKVAEFACEEECYTCRGTGTDVVRFEPGQVLPSIVDLYRSASTEAMTHYAQVVPLVVARHGDSVLTAGTALLGLGTIHTVVDYGRAMDLDDATLLAKVRGELASDTQWCQFVDKDTRVIAEHIRVSVTRNGYTMTSVASVAGAGRALLPPTYTSDVLNAPYDR